MAYTATELQQYVQDKIMASRLTTWTAQNDISYWRGLQHKYDQQLLDVVELYKNKGKALIDEYKRRLNEMDELISGAGISIVDFKSDMKALVAKALRLADKYRAVRYEIEGRQKGFFVRKPVGTTYYIDFVDGLDTNDGLSITTAWKTLEKYTTVTVRTAGDIAKVRANRTQTKTDANLNFDEDGTGADYIHLKGCSITDDPWGDQSDVRPILNFNNAVYYLDLDADDFWHLYRLEIKNSSSSQVVRIATNIRRTYLENLIIQIGNGYRALTGSGVYQAVIKDCEIKDSLTELMRFDGSFIQFINTTFNARTGGQECMAQLQTSTLEFIDCSMGQTVPFTYLFEQTGNSRVFMRNTKYVGGATSYFHREYEKEDVSWFYLEDRDQTYGAGYIDFPMGTIEKDTTVKTGNASFSAKISPNSYCSLNRPLILEDSLINFPFQVKLSASVQKTLTIKLQANTWTTFPTADELYIEASYYDSASDAGRSTIKSTAVISTADTWTDFSVTLTPQRDGIVYINCYLCKYESGKTVNVNGEVSIS
jgi:hypothetical protein